MWGGLLQQTTDVENYPGYPQGVMGPQMMQDLRDQAERFGARFITENATKVEPGHAEGEPHTVWIDDDEYKARAVVLAMGAEHKKLGVPGEEELGGRGVSYCATCDAAFFKDRETIIVGGGDSAMEEAIFLAKFSSKVTIVHRRDEFRASKIMLERARSMREHRVPDAVRRRGVPGRRGRRAGPRARAQRRDRRDARAADERRVHRDRPRAAVGDRRRASSRPTRTATCVTEGKSTRTNVPGFFAAGDLVDHTYRQAVTAAGTGCMAALDAEWYLRDNPQVPTPAALEGTGDLAEQQWAPACLSRRAACSPRRGRAPRLDLDRHVVDVRACRERLRSDEPLGAAAAVRRRLRAAVRRASSPSGVGVERDVVACRPGRRCTFTRECGRSRMR